MNKLKDKPNCDCWAHDKQVCDICQEFYFGSELKIDRVLSVAKNGKEARSITNNKTIEIVPSASEERQNEPQQ